MLHLLLLLTFVFHVVSKADITLSGFLVAENEKGDCNLDGELNWNDVNCYKEVLKYGYQYSYLDLNGDNTVSREDLLLLQDKLTR